MKIISELKMRLKSAQLRFTPLYLVIAFLGVAFYSAASGQIIGTANLNIERRGHTATLLQDGKVLIVGGENQSGIVSQAEIFDPVSRTSSLSPSSASARTEHTATTLSDGRVLLIGGRGPSGLLDSTEIYDPLTSSFSSGPYLVRPRAGHTATVLSDGKILIVGGDSSGSAELYNPATQSSSPVTGNLQTSRKFHSAILLKSGQVLIVGGVAGQDTVLNSAEIYNPQSQAFSPATSTLKTPRGLATLKLLPDGKVQVIGGDSEFSMEIYDPQDGLFNALATMPPTPDLLVDTFNTESRAALISPIIAQHPTLQGLLGSEELGYLDRADQSITELPQLNQALVAGGVTNAGQVLSSAFIVKSSPATVTTDKTDYAPGEIVTITGTGWQPGEEVGIILTEHPDEYPDIRLLAVADQQGKFVAIDFAPQPIDVGRTFTLTAVGLTSGYTAQTVFTDANISNNVAVSPASRTVTAGNPAAYTVTVNFGGNTTACTAPLSVSGLPTGAVATFDPTSVTGINGDQKTSALNITTTGATPTGSHLFTVTVSTGTGCDGSSRTATATLVVSAAPDLTATKSNNVSGSVTLGNNWTWKITVANGGSAAATFTSGQTILTDSLPGTNISYGAASTSNLSGITGTINCSISANVLTCTASGAVSIAAPGSFDVSFVATPSAVGTFANPTGGSCAVDPNNNVTESNEANNACSNSVTVTAPDLTVTKNNNVSGNTTLGSPWTWTLTVANTGAAGAAFTSGQTILTDNLPSTGLTYGSATVGSVTNVTNSSNISCSIVSNNLSCTANSATVTIGATTGTFQVSFTATPTATGTYDNPRSGGVCKVDPNNNINEGAALSTPETNNSCGPDTVTVKAPDLTVAKVNDTGDNAVTFGDSWKWTLTVSNASGTYVGAANFASTQVILSDNMPSANVFGYSAVTVTNISGTTGIGNISCPDPGTNSNNLICTATGAVSIAPSGSFKVEVTFTPSATGTFTNPRSGGSCSVDPNNVLTEANGGGTAEDNNGCGPDTVTVQAYSITASKAETPSTQQYSDKVVFSLSIPNTTVLGQTPISGDPTANFAVGTQTGVASCTLALVSGNWQCSTPATALLEPTPFYTPPTGQMAPGTKTVEATLSGGTINPNFSFTGLTNTNLFINRENANVDFLGLDNVTVAPNASSVVVPLSWEIRDITEDSPGTDPDPGDIRNARVTIMINLSPVAGCSNLTPTLPNPLNTRVGTVTCNWTKSLGSSFTGSTDTVTAVVGAAGSEASYYRGGGSDQVNIAPSLGTEFITGGGYIRNVNPQGPYAGDLGLKTNFGFNVKYNKKGTNLQGNFNAIIRTAEKTYQLKTNATQSLTLNTSTGLATFIAKCNITDITEPLAPGQPLSGICRLDVDDNGEPNSTTTTTWDLIGFQMRNLNGNTPGNILYFSSNGAGASATLQELKPKTATDPELGRGNIQVR